MPNLQLLLLRSTLVIAGALIALAALSRHGHALDLRGVNSPQLVWQKDAAKRRETIDAQRAAGLAAARVMLVNPFDQFVDAAGYAGSKSSGILLMMPMTIDPYHRPGVKKRIGKPPLIYSLPPLSEVDTDKVLKIWTKALVDMAAKGVRLEGVQVENEFNSAAFNGDLPVVEGGATLTFKNHREFAFWPQYEAGMRKLVEVLRIVKIALSESPAYKNVPVVLGGLARPADNWNKNVGNVIVEPDLALKTLIDMGADRYIDAYAIHLYPQVPRQQWDKPHDAIAKYVERRMSQVIAVAGTSKPWWVTEWGFAKRDDMKPGPDGVDRRVPLFRAFPEVLAKSRYAKLIGPTYIYDWDESRNFRIWDGSRVLGVDNFFGASAQRGVGSRPAAAPSPRALPIPGVTAPPVPQSRD